MDYSLLLAITYNSDEIEEGKETMESLKKKYENNRNVFVSPNKYIYHLGIIDYLQDFNMTKILENRFKRLRYGSKKMEDVSSIEPEPYAARYMRYVQKTILQYDN